MTSVQLIFGNIEAATCTTFINEKNGFIYPVIISAENAGPLF